MKVKTIIWKTFERISSFKAGALLIGRLRLSLDIVAGLHRAPVPAMQVVRIRVR